VSGPSAILDYASPRPQGRVRLPSRSRLDVVRDRDEVTITETLSGKGSAIGGIAVAAFTLLQLLFGMYREAWGKDGLLTRQHPSLLEPEGIWLLVMAGLWVTELVVMLIVINNTWRRTVVQARDGTLSVEFTAPFGRRRHAWPFDQVLELHVDRSLVPGFTTPKVELVWRVWGGQHVRLFTDHPEPELDAIAAALRQAMAMEARCGAP
jgi:hypothetical protein